MIAVAEAWTVNSGASASALLLSGVLAAILKPHESYWQDSAVDSMNVKLTVLLGGIKGTVLELCAPETILGRGADAQVRIPSASVSRRHCRLTLQDGYLVA